MIYKDGVKVRKIELINNETEFTCHIHLSNDRIFTIKPEKSNPSIMNNKDKLEALTIKTIVTGIKMLNEEMK